LDLLLQLIEERKLTITQVSIATVADQYIAALHARATWNPDELADFLVIASKLILLKSKALLPTLDLQDDERVGDELEEQLKMYKAFLDASRHIHALVGRRQVAFARTAPVFAEPQFAPPRHMTMTILRTVYEQVLLGIEHLLPLPQTIVQKTISIHEKIAHVKDQLMAAMATTFQKLLGSSTSKTDVIVSFLALLELVKQRFIAVEQNELFHDIHIQKTP
ncbi:segregation/condensation protein A, partial [Candidatus Uhrbacteria bacterium]|nr:segregation/condensation protein A [Candidatus Uhrbacteria bacterium]